MPKVDMVHAPTMVKMPYDFAIRVRMYPSENQKRIIKINSDASRFIYNKMVADYKGLYICTQFLRKTWTPYFVVSCLDTLISAQNSYRLHHPNKPSTKIYCDIPQGLLFHNEMILSSFLTATSARIKHQLKNEKTMRESRYWLQVKEIDSHACVAAIRSYYAAWNMFKKVHDTGIPKFHKKSYAQNYQTQNTYSPQKCKDMYSGSVRLIDIKHIKLPKLGRIRVESMNRFIRQYDFTKIRIGTTSIKMNSQGQYWVSFQLGSEIAFKSNFIKTHSERGIDMNTNNFLTLSSGESLPNQHFYQKQVKRLAKLQRVMSRRQRRAIAENRPLNKAQNYQKARLRVSKLQNHIMNQRDYFIQITTIRLVKNHDLLVMEKLSGKNMLKNHAMAMSIADTGWAVFRQKLTYKAKLYGKQVALVDPKNTTQTCHVCGYIMRGKEHIKLGREYWRCPKCGSKHVRDVNAAINILRKFKD